MIALLCAASLATSCVERQVGAPAVAPLAAPRAAATSPPPSAELAVSVPRGDAAPTPLRPAATITVPGTGAFVLPAAESRPTGRAEVTPDGDISFNFINADVQEIAREILGNQLHLDYVVDAGVQASITAQTGSPLPRSSVLPTLEGILRANGLALMQAGGLYRILPLEGAARAGAAAVAAQANRVGYAVRVLPLKYVAAPELKSVLDPFVPPGGVVQADGARNILVVSGAAGDLAGFAELVRQFDVDWLTGKSFGLYPLRVGLVKDVASELQSIIDEGGQGSSPLAGLVRIVPIERLNAILVISSQPAYLREMKTWIDRLDYGDDQTTPRFFNYYVQNSRAADLAAVLTQILSSGQVATVNPQTAPGTTTTEIGRAAAVATPGLATPGIRAPSPALGAPAIGAPGPGASGQLAPGMPIGQAQGYAPQQRQAELVGAATGPSPPAQGELQLPSVRVVADEKNNALVIFARPRDYRMIEGIIQKLDIVPLQVLIEATIAEVTLNDALQYGLAFFLKSGRTRFELTRATSGTLTAADIAGIFPGFNFVLNAGTSQEIISLLSSISNVNVISSPQLLVLDHQTAALQVGDQVPIVTQQAESVITANAPIINSVQYRNTGVVLHVTPRVNSSGLITLDIDQEVSDVATTTTSTINSPTINDRHFASSVIVQDGQTIALGGLISENHNDTKSGIPVLSDLPIVGALFRQTTRSIKRTELLVLLAPRVVRNPKEAHDLTEELSNRMRSVKPLRNEVR
jgi:general secretion pathway protein D